MKTQEKDNDRRRYPSRQLQGLAAVAGAFALGVGATVGISSFHGGRSGIPEASASGAAAAPATPLEAAGSVPSAAAPIDSTNIFVNLAKKAIPAVVNISTSKLIRSPFVQGAPDDLFRRLFQDFFQGQGGMGLVIPPGFQGMPGPNGDDGSEQLPSGPRAQGRPGKPISRPLALGTGFIIDSSGIILTNNHVVQGADEIKVQFTEDPGEQPTEAKVIGRDPMLDVALIRVKTHRKLAALPLGDSDAAQVGEYVLAVGNPFGQGHSASHGILSAKGRVNPESPIGSYLQTDAPINPGNSGGPLINLRGEVVGINTAIDARAQGIGFAIPINLVKGVLPQLEEKGSVSRGYIGAAVGEMSPAIAEKLGIPRETRAPFIASVNPGEPAAKAGVEPYDVVEAVNGKAVHAPSELVAAITSLKVGSHARLEILRNGHPREISVLIATRPGTQELAKAGGSERDDGDASGENGSKGSVHTGMSLENLTPETARVLGISPGLSGVVVSDVESGSPADRAGLSRGDLIVEVDRKPVRDIRAFHQIVNSSKKSYLLRIRKAAGRGQDVYVIGVLDLRE